MSNIQMDIRNIIAMYKDMKFAVYGGYKSDIALLRSCGADIVIQYATTANPPILSYDQVYDQMLDGVYVIYTRNAIGNLPIEDGVQKLLTAGPSTVCIIMRDIVIADVKRYSKQMFSQGCIISNNTPYFWPIWKVQQMEGSDILLRLPVSNPRVVSDRDKIFPYLHLSDVKKLMGVLTMSHNSPSTLLDLNKRLESVPYIFPSLAVQKYRSIFNSDMQFLTLITSVHMNKNPFHLVYITDECSYSSYVVSLFQQFLCKTDLYCVGEAQSVENMDVHPLDTLDIKSYTGKDNVILIVNSIDAIDIVKRIKPIAYSIHLSSNSGPYMGLSGEIHTAPFATQDVCDYYLIGYNSTLHYNNKEINPSIIKLALNWHTVNNRCVKYDKYVDVPDVGLCSCYDCTCEMKNVRDYLILIGADISDQSIADAILNNSIELSSPYPDYLWISDIPDIKNLQQVIVTDKGPSIDDIARRIDYIGDLIVEGSKLDEIDYAKILDPDVKLSVTYSFRRDDNMYRDRFYKFYKEYKMMLQNGQAKMSLPKFLWLYSRLNK